MTSPPGVDLLRARFLRVKRDLDALHKRSHTNAEALDMTLTLVEVA